MMVSLRLKDELVAEIDRIAHASGQTRSAWLTNHITRAALHRENDDLPQPVSKGRGNPTDPMRVTVRLTRSETEAIETVGAHMGLTRSEWIKRTIRWQLWDKAAMLRLAPISQSELGKLRKQVMAIGRNINQAVHAMNAANQPESSLDIARIAQPFLETCADLKSLLFDTRRAASFYVGAEVGYWTGTFREAVQ